MCLLQILNGGEKLARLPNRTPYGYLADILQLVRLCALLHSREVALTWTISANLIETLVAQDLRFVQKGPMAKLHDAKMRRKRRYEYTSMR